MKNTKYISGIIIVFMCTLQVFSQVEVSKDINHTIKEISAEDLVHFANNGELISEVQSLDFHIKIYKVRNGLVGIDEDFLSKECDLYIAVTIINNTKKLYKVSNLQNVRDVRWLEIGEVPEFRCNYTGSPNTRTARFKIYTDKIERLY